MLTGVIVLDLNLEASVLDAHESAGNDTGTAGDPGGADLSGGSRRCTTTRCRCLHDVWDGTKREIEWTCEIE